ncbi:DUF938 domain-containing protein [Altericroceibacterium endophyticum]|uniref:DUF938 domain-containing protein n=1 Tax=Altericroceibacterium endophyticum TaxID=1808508 RepID=A0A6I4SZM4_9SPHN|nr:DUF938 domain-containing protein [Altericroceibacterium endophyticum]
MKYSAPAAARNRVPIAEILSSELPKQGQVLEIASGSGEHVLYFAAQFPQLDWQPSDPSTEAQASIDDWAGEYDGANLLPALALDASAAIWPTEQADAILCINMIHISPWSASEGLFAGAKRLLDSGQPLILYGPYFEAGIKPAESNLAFDASLKSRCPDWGIRQLAAIDALAQRNGFQRMARYAMPANNLTLVYRKQ